MFMTVCAPPGVGPSATVELPPPTLRPPQVRVLRTVPPVPPLRTDPQGPPAAPVTKLTQLPPPGPQFTATGGGSQNPEQVGFAVPPLQTSLPPVSAAIAFHEQVGKFEQKQFTTPPLSMQYF